MSVATFLFVVMCGFVRFQHDRFVQPLIIKHIMKVAVANHVAIDKDMERMYLTTIDTALMSGLAVAMAVGYILKHKSVGLTLMLLVFGLMWAALFYWAYDPIFNQILYRSMSGLVYLGNVGLIMGTALWL